MNEKKGAPRSEERDGEFTAKRDPRQWSEEASSWSAAFGFGLNVFSGGWLRLLPRWTLVGAAVVAVVADCHPFLRLRQTARHMPQQFLPQHHHQLHHHPLLHHHHLLAGGFVCQLLTMWKHKVAVVAVAVAFGVVVVDRLFFLPGKA